MKSARKRRARLPYKAAVKIGCAAFKTRPLRLIATVLLSAVAFAFFALSLSLSLVDRDEVTANTFGKNGVRETAISKKSGSLNLRFRDEDVAFIAAETGEGVLPAIFVGIEIDDLSPNGEETAYEPPIGITAADSDTLDKFGYTVSGRLPETSDEVALTLFTAGQILRRGFKDGESLGAAEELIGRALVINGTPFTVTGLIDTKMDESRYESIRNYGAETGSLAKELQTLLVYSAHDLLFLSDLSPYIDKASFDLPAYGFLQAGRSNFTISTIEKAGGGTESASDVADKGEVYLPAAMLSDILSELPCEVSYGGKSYFDHGALLVALFDEYLPAHIDELYAEGVSNGYSGSKEEYAALLQTQAVNPYGKSGWELCAELYADRGEEFGFPEELTVTFTVAGQGISFRVGGWLNENVGRTLCVNAAAYEQLHTAWGGEYDTVLLSLSSKNAVLRIPTNSPENSESGENNAVYAANHYLINGIEKAMSAVGKIRVIARIAAAAFGVFAALLFVQFITQSVADRSQTLVVLRTLGASKAETAKIFILQALLIGGSVFVSALLIGGLGCIVLNKFFAAVIGAKISVVTFGAATIFTLLFSVIALSVIGALVPVLHATHTDKLIMNE